MHAGSGAEDSGNIVRRATIGCAGGERRRPHLFVGEPVRADHRAVAMPQANFLQFLEVYQLEINDDGVRLLVARELLPQFAQTGHPVDFPEVCAQVRGK